MTKYNDKGKIIEHYDLLSPYYYSLWGRHLHHGYWIKGNETKEEAQIALVEYLVKRAGIRAGDSVLDVGCGFGGSSIYLAKNYKANTVGITISPVQVEMATADAAVAGVNSKFFHMDAEAMKFDQQFDVAWSIESISHYQNKERFFDSLTDVVKQGGTIAFIDWFKKENQTAANYKKFIQPIEKGMFVELRTMTDYRNLLDKNGFVTQHLENISKKCAKTWDISLDIIKNKKFWQLALRNGSQFTNFLKSFCAMKAGFGSGNFIYGVIIAKKT